MKVWAKNEIISIAIFSPADCIVFFLYLFQPLLRTVPCSAEKEECIVLPTMADYLPFVRKQDTPNLPVLHNKHCTLPKSQQTKTNKQTDDTQKRTRKALCANSTLVCNLTLYLFPLQNAYDRQIADRTVSQCVCFGYSVFW